MQKLTTQGRRDVREVLTATLHQKHYRFMLIKKAHSLLIALLALGGISWQFHLNASDPALADIGTRAWQMAMYFTNITNAIVGASMLWLVFGKRISANFLATITLAIVMGAMPESW